VCWKLCSSCWSFHLLREEFLLAPIHSPPLWFAVSVLQPPTRSVGPTDRSAGLLVGRTHLSGMVVSLVSGDPGVPMSHKSQRKRHRVPKAEVGSMSQIPEYVLDCLPMRSPWKCLKTSTQTYRELDVRPHRS
jgi:hypothetical protein